MKKIKELLDFYNISYNVSVGNSGNEYVYFYEYDYSIRKMKSSTLEETDDLYYWIYTSNGFVVPRSYENIKKDLERIND